MGLCHAPPAKNGLCHSKPKWDFVMVKQLCEFEVSVGKLWKEATLAQLPLGTATCKMNV
jgi:hypothetical protein